jgi:hypothetical protein
LKSDFCDFTTLSIEDPISGDRFYDIVETGKEPELFEIYASTYFVVAGAGPGEGCVEQLTMALETYVAGGFWLEIQDENTPDMWIDCDASGFCDYKSLEDEPVYFYKYDSYASIYLHINTTEYAEGEILYDQTDGTITAPFRVVFYTEDGTLVESLTQSFTIITTDNVDVDPCADAELELSSYSAVTVYEVVFGEHDLMDISINNTLSAKFKDQAHSDCLINYYLKIYNNDQSTYVDWQAEVDNLK